MTRDEAIKKIKSLCHGCVEFPHCVNTDPDCFKALEMAIDSLKTDSTIKEAYNKGYKDGQEALAYHLELCKEEGSIVTVPDGATNGQMIRTMFPDAKIVRGYKEYILVTFSGSMSMSFNMDWWDAPYRKEQE